MSSLFSELGGITAGAGAEGLAFAAGFAASHALEPEAVTIRQEAWNAARVLRIPPQLAAAIAAENIGSFPDMQTEAHYYGWDDTRFPLLYHLSLVAPDTGELLQMVRRDTLKQGQFAHGLRKGKLEPEWDQALADLANVYLSPDILAVMLQRAVIPNQGQLPGADLTTTGLVPRFPQVPIDAYAMAKTFGWSKDQLDAQARIQGLPPGMDLVARMVFRKIVERGDFNLAAEQSNRRVEWADFEFDGYRQIPTAHDGVEGRLRGWLNDTEMYAQTARHGMSEPDTDLLFKITGRPLSFHQVFIGLRRGGVYDGPIDHIDPAFLKALRESNVRPEWYNLAWAQRNSLPSVFAIRMLTEAGTWSQAKTETRLLWLGWVEEDAKETATAWAAMAGGSVDAHVKAAQTALRNTTHRSYIAAESDDATATTALEAAGVEAGSVPAVLALWAQERELVRKQLTPAQIKKAYKESAINAETTVAWTRDEALAALIARGYSSTDADSFLNI